MRAACRWAPTCRRCPRAARARRRSFVVWAVKDPSSGNLDRIQVVKGWTQNGQSFEKVFDVVWSGDRKPDKWSGRVPAIRSTVDLDKATYTNDVGSAELKTVWSDPEFDASLHAFYYAARAGDPDAALDADPGGEGRAAAARRGAAHRPGARLDLADLVRAVGRVAQGGCGGHDRRRPQGEGRQCAERRAAEGAARRQGDLAAQQRDRRAVLPALHGRRADDRVARRHGRRLPERVRQRRARRLRGNDHRLPHRRRQARHPGGAGSVLVHLLQGRRHLLSPRAATSSAMPTTRSCRRRRSPPIR